MERTFIMLKPDAVQRGLCGQILTRLESKGFQLIAMKLRRIDEQLAGEHYKEHADQAFYPELLEFICSGPVLAMVWEGRGVIAAMRRLMGSTNPLEAAPGTIRGDFGASLSRNIIHGSDSQESAKREIALFFREEELLSYDRSLHKWMEE